MRIIGWTLTVVFWTLVAAFFHYTLPQKDIVYVQGTEILRTDFTFWNRSFYSQADVGNDETVTNRDLRLINATRANGNVIVYRNEDTGFSWPPYFKVTSSDLQAEAQGAVTTKANPQWYLMTHYGWRLNVPTVYPNAISLRPHPGPDAPKPWPWVNILILTSVAAVWYGLWVRWRRFRQKRIDPTLEQIQDNLEEAGDRMAARRGRARKWLDSWRS